MYIGGGGIEQKRTSAYNGGGGPIFVILLRTYYLNGPNVNKLNIAVNIVIKIYGQTHSSCNQIAKKIRICVYIHLRVLATFNISSSICIFYNYKLTLTIIFEDKYWYDY